MCVPSGGEWQHARSGRLELFELLPQLFEFLLQLPHGSVVALAHRLLVIAQNRHLRAAWGAGCPLMLAAQSAPAQGAFKAFSHEGTDTTQQGRGPPDT